MEYKGDFLDYIVDRIKFAKSERSAETQSGAKWAGWNDIKKAFIRAYSWHFEILAKFHSKSRINGRCPMDM